MVMSLPAMAVIRRALPRMVPIRPNNNLNMPNILNRLRKDNKRSMMSNNKPLVSPERNFLSNHNPSRPMGGVHLVLLGGPAAVAVVVVAVEDTAVAFPVEVFPIGLVVMILMEIIRALAGMTAELMASPCLARRQTH